MSQKGNHVWKKQIQTDIERQRKGAYANGARKRQVRLDSWEIGYRHAEQYYEMNGNLMIPSDYVCDDNFRLGSWIVAQRSAAKGKTSAQMTGDRVAALNSIGMVWDVRAANWKNGYEHARQYYGERKDLLVPATYKCKDGFSLGAWITTQRNARLGRGTYAITEERISALDRIGMVWNVREAQWQEKYKEAKKYFQENGDIKVPYDNEQYNSLRSWVTNQEQAIKGKGKRKMTPEWKEKLALIGMKLKK